MLDSRSVIKVLRQHGWKESYVSTRKAKSTSHIILRHPDNPYVLSFPRQSKDLGKGMVAKIKRLASPYWSDS